MGVTLLDIPKFFMLPDEIRKKATLIPSFDNLLFGGRCSKFKYNLLI